jgi:replicative DNA helicase
MMARRATTAGPTPRTAPDRVPPHNLEAEESLLGSMMLSASAIGDAADVVRSNDFYREAHRLVYEAILSLYSRGEPVDLITTVEELRRRWQLEQVGGPLYLHNLVESVPTPASAGYYARIVAHHAMLRRLIEASARIMSISYAVPDDPRKAVDEAESLIYSVARRGEPDAVISVGPVVDETIDSFEKLQQRSGSFAGLPTGLADLDEMLCGLQSGSLILVAARPGVGKSSFVVNVARNVAIDSATPVALFSLEMSRVEIGMRLLCADARVPWTKIRAGRVGADDWARLVAATEAMHEAPMYIADSGSITIVDVRAKARRLRSARPGLGLVVVDYLQLMSSVGRRETRQLEVAELSRSLKLLAKELDVPVIAVSQLNRDPERRIDKRPQLTDLKDSGSLEQDADVVLFLHRSEQESTRGHAARLIVAKHRNGPTGELQLSFVPECFLFRNYAPAP